MKVARGPFARKFRATVSLSLAVAELLLLVLPPPRLARAKRAASCSRIFSDDPRKMIRFILLQNRQGKTRLAKYYVPLEDSEKHKVEYEVHRLVVNRDPKFTNFVEFRTHKVIYRRYAGLFFSLCVDITDNELAYLECIHLFVEILDHFFSNVCELDLVFNFHKVYLILDEFILAGEIQETKARVMLLLPSNEIFKWEIRYSASLPSSSVWCSYFF
ncbi:Clat_adaptor_s domain-containing protein [Psidium guajava]|nr:Clat_adaptor_s domain-containing protein [Psidium guajava]